MKPFNVILNSLLFAALLINASAPAQDAFSSINLTPSPLQSGPLSLSVTDVITFKSFSDDQLAALITVLDATPQIPCADLPRRGMMGNFFSLEHPEWPPLPMDSSHSPVWPINGGYLVNDVNYNYDAASAMSLATSPQMQTSTQSDDGLLPPGAGGGSGTNSYTPNDSPYTPPDYGTNLWIAETAVVSNSVAGIISNSTPGVELELQYTTDLTQPWQSTNWLFYGADATNWTPFSVPAISSSNLFLRVRSWADDGSGLPLWWQLQYFGTTGIDPYGDPAGDGWNNLQKFQAGWNPNVFYTPAAPQGFTAVYNANDDSTLLNWLPAAGPVTGYTVQKADYFGGTVNYPLSANATSLTDNNTLTGDFYTKSFSIQANYTNGNSAWNTIYVNDVANPSFDLINGVQGRLTLLIHNLPKGLSVVRVYRASNQSAGGGYNIWPFAGAGADYPTDLPDGSFDIPATNIVNGIVPIPSTQAFAFGEYNFSVQFIYSNGTSSAVAGGSSGVNNVFVDGRTQLKDDLRFRLRAATDNGPFEIYPDLEPLDYAYSGFYPGGAFAALNPFYDNNRFHNLLFDATNLLTSDVNYDPPYASGAFIGMPNTGVFYEDSHDTIDSDVALAGPPMYEWTEPSLVTTNTPVAPPSHLTAPLAQWIVPPALEFTGGVPSGYQNYYGLACEAQLFVIYTNNQFVYMTGNSGDLLPSLPGMTYLDLAEPGFQTDGYYFARPGIDPLPEQNIGSYPYSRPNVFSLTNTPPLLITSVGSSLTLAGYAKLEVTNSAYTGIYGFLGQYFDTAYRVDDNGNMTTNVTGVLSPYGNFLATEPGPTALVTMPDVDTGERGTCMVYSVSLQLDKNHDGNMDLSFNGVDATTTKNPMVVWANNNYDRFTLDADDQIEYDDDVKIGGDYFTQNTPVPDYNFKDGAGHRVIPCARDLQDFFRLWVCGIDTNLIAKLPAGSTVTLNWGDVGSPNTGNPTIDIFAAADTDGGIGYLTNSLTAEIQTDPVICPYIGRLGPGQSIQLNAIQFANGWAGSHFIMCGVSNGTGGLNLTIKDGSGNVLAQSTSYLQIVDIKQMYERWTIGDTPSIALKTNAVPATEDLPIGASAFQYTQPQDTNTSYILYVHGWNMERWEKDRFAESAFKRLYWQGYKGRFGVFRWPTENGFKGISSLATDPSEKDNFDRSEYTAWQSSVGLLNKLKDLNAEYPGHVYMLAHSMGNIVAGEALRLATQQGLGHLVNTYVASQAAVSAHTYDTNIANYSFNYFPWRSQAVTPNIYGNWFLGNNGGGAGQVVNFYNTNDYALQRSVWQLDQLLKPDQFVLLGGTHWDYSYVGVTNDPPPWNHFQKDASLQIWNEVNFDIVNVLTNRYEVMGLAAQPWTTAFGATPGVQNVSQDIDLTQFWPPDLVHPTHPFDEHFYHSAEFRGDYWQQQGYWNELLGPEVFNLK